MLNKLNQNGFSFDYSQVKIGYVELYLKQHNPKAYNLGLFKE